MTNLEKGKKRRKNVITGWEKENSDNDKETLFKKLVLPLANRKFKN